MNARIPFLLLIAMLPCVVRADTAPQAEDVRLTIHPAAPAKPALRDALLPEPVDQAPGNAATVYLIAFEDAGRLTSDPSFDALRDATVAELDDRKATELLSAHGTMLEQLSVAARRSECDWAPPTRERGLRALLPYLNTARVAGDLLSIKAKLAIKRRNYPEAIGALRDGFALADHLEREPLIVQTMVAVGIRRELLGNVRELIEQPGAPNLYWPLANLPPAGRDRVRIVQTEKAALFVTCPELRHVEQLSAAESRRVFEKLRSLVDGNRPEWWAELLLGMVRNYPKAKQFLTEQGRPRDAVEAMPADTAILAFYVAQYVEQFDEVNKHAGLPLWQAYAQIAQPTAAEDGPRGTAPLHSYGYSGAPDDPRTYNPLLAILPAYHQAFSNVASVERDRAMLQVEEGIRAYAAAHNGAVPQSLDRLSPETPAPLDPMLNRPFEYRADGDTATLVAPAPPGEPPQFAKTFHITVAH